MLFVVASRHGSPQFPSQCAQSCNYEMVHIEIFSMARRKCMCNFCLFSRHSSEFEMHKMIKVFVMISSLLHRFSNSSTKQNVEKNYLISSNDNNNEKAYISAFQNKKNAIQKWTSPMIVQFRRKVNKYSDITETYDHSKSNLFN